MRKCKTCNLEKEESEFYKNRNNLLTSCKKCKNKNSLEYQKRYREKNNHKVKEWTKNSKNKRNSDPEKRDRILEQKRLSHIRNIKHILWKRTKDRANKKNLEFNLLEDDLVIPKICPILEIPIFVGNSKNYKNSPTIDRIDNSKGYVKDNVMIISMLANSMKNSASLEELKTFSKNIINYINNNNDIV